MIYRCMNRNCQFLFERYSEPEQCPDCGYPGIREAAPEEKDEFIARQQARYLANEKLPQ